MSSRQAQWPLVARREIAVRLRDRNFLISTALTVFIAAASFGLSALLSGRTETSTVAVQDAQGGQIVRAAQGLATAQGDDSLRLTSAAAPGAAEVERRLRDGSADLGLLTSGDRLVLVGLDGTDGAASTYLTQAYAQSKLAANAKAAGTSLERLSTGSVLQTRVLDPEGISPLTATIGGMVFAFLFFFVSLMFGISIAQSVTSEKENRIVEILAGLVPVRQLLIGKIVGNVLLALAQLALLCAVGIVGVRMTALGDELPHVGSAGGWFIAFFLVGFFAIAALWAAAGALASRNEDLQQTQTPVLMLVMLVLFAGLYLPEGARVAASFVPMVNIVAMPVRVLQGGVAWWEPVVSLLILAGAAAALVMLAERIYRRSVMRSGGRVTMRQALSASD